MGAREGEFVAYFYQKYQGRVAISVGDAQDMQEVFPFVFEDGNGHSLGIIALAILPAETKPTVHIYHLSAFMPGQGDGGKILSILCRKADWDHIVLTVSPIPSPSRGRMVSVESTVTPATTGVFHDQGATPPG